MEVGFIGAGNVTRTIGRHLINAGHTVVASNSRGPETPSEFVAELGPSACAGTKQQSAECDMVILATRWVNVPEALTGIDWQERILRCDQRAYGFRTRSQPGGSRPVVGCVKG